MLKYNVYKLISPLQLVTHNLTLMLVSSLNDIIQIHTFLTEIDHMYDLLR